METDKDKTSPKNLNRSVHMANERTFLAWIRTSIGIMAFGFVVEKFSLFIKQISYFLGKSGIPASQVPPPLHGYSSVFGIFLVGLGALIGVLAFIKYKDTGRQIDNDTYHPSSILDTLITLIVLAVGIFLVIYLIQST